jgi:hypothetical protein
MRAVVTRNAVRRQLAAMSGERFDIGVLRPDGRMLLREDWTPDQINTALAWLRRENAHGAHIYVRPSGTHALSLLDDLTAEAIARMKGSGFQPAVVVETSPDNFQAWLNHGRVLDRKLSTHVTKELARRFGGDLSSADWRHFGRLAGFTNQKPARRLENGLSPFVRLHDCKELKYNAADEFLNEVSLLIEKAHAERQAQRPSRSSSTNNPMRCLSDFYGDARYGGDRHRADMAWALRAASRGLSEQQITDEILHQRDLSKKGGPPRQLDYAARTAVKAVRSCHPTPK